MQGIILLFLPAEVGPTIDDLLSSYPFFLFLTPNDVCEFRVVWSVSFVPFWYVLTKRYERSRRVV